jgi:NCS1 family nucleobase:cation symporter-1
MNDESGVADALEHDAEVLAASVERHSVDWIPLEERTASLRTVGATWFVGNINLTIMAAGVAALAVGTSLFWTLVALIVGSLFGTIFMAFHSSQGPQLGLPQLIQSRPQFGYLGAAVSVFLIAALNYYGYNVIDALLVGSAANELVGIPTGLGFPLAALFSATLAIFGFHWIVKINKYLAIPSIALVAILTVAVLINSGLPANAFAPGHFELAPFMTIFVIGMANQLLWAPYVSDYTRYLPPSVGVRASVLCTYVPSALSIIWVFAIGAIAAAGAPEGAAPISAFRIAGDAIFSGFGNVAVVGLLVGLLMAMTLNAYGGSLAMISIADSFRPIKPTRRIRVAAVITMAVVVWTIAQLVGEEGFFDFYSNTLIFLAYVFTPWTAINLVDFFFVRRGVYSIAEIFNPNGLYHRWGVRGLTAYVVGLACMAPFFVTEPFTGWIARHLDSVDYSIFVGLPVAGGLYYLLCRGMNLRPEMEKAREEGVLSLHHIRHHLPDEETALVDANGERPSAG